MVRALNCWMNQSMRKNMHSNRALEILRIDCDVMWQKQVYLYDYVEVFCAAQDLPMKNKRIFNEQETVMISFRM